MNWYLTTSSDEISIVYDEKGQLSIRGSAKIQSRHHSPYDGIFYREHEFLDATRELRFKWGIASRAAIEPGRLTEDLGFLNRMIALQPNVTHAIARFVEAHPPYLLAPQVNVSLFAPDHMFREFHSLCSLAMQVKSQSVRLSLGMIGFERRSQTAAPEADQLKGELSVEDAEAIIWDAAPCPLTDDFKRESPAFGWFRELSVASRLTSTDSDDD